MKHDKKTLASIIAGHSIVQIAPTGVPDHAGLIGIVAEKLSWGARIVLGPGKGVASIAWSNLEPTGGFAFWGPDGKELTLPAKDEPTNHA